MRKMFMFLFFSLMGCSCIILAQSSSDIQAYISKYKQIALEQERNYGIPAPITLAQGILESGAGKSELTRNSNNHFGIKALGGWSGRIYLAWDDETEKSRFRCYDSAEESFKDHSEFLKNCSPRVSMTIVDGQMDYSVRDTLLPLIMLRLLLDTLMPTSYIQ